MAVPAGRRLLARSHKRTPRAQLCERTSRRCAATGLRTCCADPTEHTSPCCSAPTPTWVTRWRADRRVAHPTGSIGGCARCLAQSPSTWSATTPNRVDRAASRTPLECSSWPRRTRFPPCSPMPCATSCPTMPSRVTFSIPPPHSNRSEPSNHNRTGKPGSRHRKTCTRLPGESCGTPCSTKVPRHG